MAEELDIMYRSALEITRRGELQISIPENISVCKAKLPEFPSKLKRSSKMADVSSRVDKISKIVSMLKDTYFDADPSNIAPFPKLFTVKIDYVITSAPKEGIIFRKRAGTDTVSVLSTSHSNRNTSNTEYVEDKECACVYTLSQGVTGTLDPHGVRCWLPCFDHPSQRPAFDLTLTAPSHMAFTCTGRLISSTTHESVTKSATMRTNRYFTVNRIPTRAVGFFIGLSEQYSIPLYRTVGHTWVARGLMDYIPTRGQVLPARVSKTASIHQSQNGTNMNKKARLDSSIENRNPNNSESNDIMKSDEVAVTEVEIEGEVEVVEEVEDNDILKAEQNLCGGRLYREHVRHSTLGLDLAMRLIHKHTQRRYEHPQYTQIFVHGLEEDFLSFDGFSLIDAR